MNNNQGLMNLERPCLFQVPNNATLSDSRALRAVVKGATITIVCSRCGQFILRKEELLQLIDTLLASDKVLKLTKHMTDDTTLQYQSSYDAENEQTEIKLFHKNTPFNSFTYRLSDDEVFQFEGLSYVSDRHLRLFLAFRIANEAHRLEVLAMLIDAAKYLNKY